jgi:hypothetical protein
MHPGKNVNTTIRNIIRQKNQSRKQNDTSYQFLLSYT